jgi:phosphoribosyl-ATP pyrophosphohydrolase/phosphoribosyl-AMP cyclohydrolase
MNRESLQSSMEKELTCFWSRSRGELWLKGETSGNYQHIVSITADCDRDALVVEVRKDGPACHKGTDSCFNEVIFEGDAQPGFAYEDLMQMLEGRKNAPKEGSYTSYLFAKGLDKILKRSARSPRRSSSPPRTTTRQIRSMRSAISCTTPWF